jgi:hypothetical protein
MAGRVEYPRSVSRLNIETLDQSSPLLTEQIALADDALRVPSACAVLLCVSLARAVLFRLGKRHRGELFVMSLDV